MNHVVFAEGLVEFRGRWHIYYGGADKVVGLAAAEAYGKTDVHTRVRRFEGQQMRGILSFIRANPEVSIIFGFLAFIIGLFASYELALVAFGE